MGVLDQFDTFWKNFPRKVGKGDARKAFATAIKKTSLDVMLDALRWQTTQPAWTKDGGVFIPYPATWLRAERWEDEPFHAPPNGNGKSDPYGQREKMRRVQELIKTGLSRADANRQVFK